MCAQILLKQLLILLIAFAANCHATEVACHHFSLTGKRHLRPPASNTMPANKLGAMYHSDDKENEGYLNLPTPIAIPSKAKIETCSFTLGLLSDIQSDKNYGQLKPYVPKSPDCIIIGFLNKLLRSHHTQNMSPTKLCTPDLLAALNNTGISTNKLRTDIQVYKAIRPNPVINHESFGDDKTDAAAARIVLARDIMHKLHTKKLIESPSHEAYKPPIKKMTDEEWREARHRMSTLQMKLNISITPTNKDPNALYALEMNVLSPFEKWVKGHKVAGTAETLDPQLVNLMLYQCLQTFIQKGLYHTAQHPDGYLWVYPSIIEGKWKGRQKLTNIELTQTGRNLVDIKGRAMEAHHVSTDILTYPEKHTEYHARMNEEGGDRYKGATLEEMFKEWCVVIVLTKAAHDHDIHPFYIKPNRNLFATVRRDMNKKIHTNLWAKK